MLFHFENLFVNNVGYVMLNIYLDSIGNQDDKFVGNY